MTASAASALARFRTEYGAHRATEGRAYDRAQLLALPYLTSGPLARQWGVRARTFEVFVNRVLAPSIRELDRPLRLLDLGAGNGWLCWRAAVAGCDAVAVDIREDDVDGLGAAATYIEHLRGAASARFGQLVRIVASFDALPLDAGRFDIVVFNASIHYALDLEAVMREARRVVRAGGRIAILDSPFYDADSDGVAMVAEKRRNASRQFGDRAESLTALPFIEYLTRERLSDASEGLGLAWRRHRVRYPMWYELRPIVARLRGRRVPSRFDVWEATAA